jgi:TetR/AcrR family transcriptional regulator
VVARKRTSSHSSVAAVDPQLRHPGAVLGPRASRTIESILDATRQIFLVKGYAGTTIDEIARNAGLSRGSFYTYFPSKRDVLLALGANSLHAGMDLIASLDQLDSTWTIDDLDEWVGQYFTMLEDHGSFAFAWTQAAHEDEEIRRAGMKGHLELCRRMGVAMAELGGTPAVDPTERGLLAYSMLERGWSYTQLYEGTVDRTRLQHTLARMLAAAIKAPS